MTETDGRMPYFCKKLFHAKRFEVKHIRSKVFYHNTNSSTDPDFPGKIADNILFFSGYMIPAPKYKTGDGKPTHEPPNRSEVHEIMNKVIGSCK